MTAEQIIREIAALSPQEREKVVRFTRQWDGQGQLSGDELAALAERMTRTKDPREQHMLREEISRGFYGDKPDAQD